MKSIVYLFLLTLILPAQGKILDNYVKTALESNLALKQKKFSYEKSLASLSEARGMFFPSVNLEARYTQAGGGRKIDIPVGDLVNPVYRALNQITGTNSFPTDIPNQTTNFLREKEHETKLEMIQPLFNPAIYYNYKAKSDLTEVYKAERDAFARNLTAEVKTAYFNYLKTVEIKKLLISAEELVKENLRVSESLFKNGKVTKDAVYKAEAELSKIIQQQSESEKNSNLAKAYLNFLMNRDLEEEILTDDNSYEEEQMFGEFEELEKNAVLSREELSALNMAIQASDNGISAAKSSYYPAISLVFDYGFQGEEYKFTDKDDYWMASVVMQWNIFRGLSDKAKTEQSKISKMEIEMQKAEAENKIKLQVREAYYNLIVAKEAVTTTSKRQRSSELSFKIIEQKYSEGMSPQIEFLDARNTLTQSQIEASVAKFDYRIKMAQLEYAAAILKLELE